MLPNINNNNVQDSEEQNFRNAQELERVLVKLNSYIEELRVSSLGFFTKTYRIMAAEFKAGAIEGILDVVGETGRFDALAGLGGDLEGVEDRLDELIDEVKDNNEKERIQRRKQEVLDEETRRESDHKEKVKKEKTQKVKTKSFGMDNVQGFLDSVFSNAALLFTPQLLGALVLTKISTSFLGFVGKLLTFTIGTIMRAPGITGLAGAIVVGAMDSVDAAVKQLDWNVGGLVARITGFMVGTDNTIKSQFLTSLSTYKTVGKWAAIGAGVGSLFPVVGTLLGGLIGAGIGLMLAWFGPERISRFINAVTEEFQKFSDVLFGTDFYLNPEVLKEKIDKTKAHIDVQNKELNDNISKIQSLEEDLQAARRQGNQDLIDSISSNIQALKDRNESIRDNISAANGRIEELKQDMELEQQTYLSRIADYFGFTDLFNYIENSLKNTLDARLQTFKNLFETVDAIIPDREEVFKMLADFATGIVDSMTQTFKDLFTNIKDFFVEDLPKMFNDVIYNAMPDMVKEFFKEETPFMDPENQDIGRQRAASGLLSGTDTNLVIPDSLKRDADSVSAFSNMMDQDLFSSVKDKAEQRKMMQDFINNNVSGVVQDNRVSSTTNIQANRNVQVPLNSRDTTTTFMQGWNQ